MPQFGGGRRLTVLRDVTKVAENGEMIRTEIGQYRKTDEVEPTLTQVLIQRPGHQDFFGAEGRIQAPPDSAAEQTTDPSSATGDRLPRDGAKVAGDNRRRVR